MQLVLDIVILKKVQKYLQTLNVVFALEPKYRNIKKKSEKNRHIVYGKFTKSQVNESQLEQQDVTAEKRNPENIYCMMNSVTVTSIKAKHRIIFFVCISLKFLCGLHII